MNSRINKRRSAGFSLIEVMVAIVIVSIGLLALASLQLALIRSSSDTKAQSTAMALAKGALETAEQFTSLAGYTALTDSTLTTQTVGGVTYDGGVSVDRYVYNKAGVGTKYVNVADTLTDAQIKALSANYVPGREFKRLVATVTWTDSSGQNQRVRVEGAVSALDPADSIAVAQLKNLGAARKAVAIISNPAAAAGVIPIAIGNGTDTAATNPRPILLSQGNSTTLVETRFDIYTYAALNGATATAQSRVETSVIGCTCRTAGGTTTSFRPTYWNGFKYVTPDTVAGTPVSNPKTGVDQSSLCTACCQDHQDPAAVTGAKFDPRRSTHNHYIKSDLTTAVDMTTSGHDYNEACRLIRTDGVFHVAPDTYDDYFGLLATAGLNTNSPSNTLAQAVPGSSQTTNYQTFVLNYLHQRFITGSQANYNVPLNWATVTGNSALDAPSSAAISSASTPQYLHARGLYIDYLTPEVRQLVHDAGLTPACKGTDGNDADTAAEFEACVFKLLPFTSINLTELVSFSATAPLKVDIDTSLFKNTINTAFPVQGKASLKVGANTGDTSTGQATIQRSSAGLAVTSKVFPDTELNESYVPNMETDSNNQLFTVGVNNSPPSNEFFTLLMTGSEMLAVVDYNNKPAVTTTVSNTACSSDSVSTDNVVAGDMDKILTDDNNTSPDEFRCVPDSGSNLGGSVTVTVSNYNRQASIGVNNACSSAAATMPYSKDFDVTAATQYVQVTAGVDANNDGDYLDVGDTAPVYTTTSLGTGSVSGTDRPGTIAAGGEYTTFVVNPLATGARLQVDFGARANRCPANWSTYLNNGGAATNLTNQQQHDLCLGNGNNATPNWDTTSWIDCPNGVSIP